MEALPGGRVGLGPGDHVDAPGQSAFGVEGKQCGGSENKVVSGEEAEVEPFTDLGPGLSLELRLGIGSYDAPAVGVGAEGPQDDPGHSR